jgi:hypothetical protein
MKLKDRNKPVYARILWQQDFQVPRSEDYPTLGGENRQLTPLERDRWVAAKNFCPWWFRDFTTNFLEELDRLVLITDEDLEQADAPIVCIEPSFVRDSGFCTRLVFEDGEFEIITDWETPIHSEEEWNDLNSWDSRTKRGYDYLPYLGREFHDRFPTARYGLALRNRALPSKWDDE